MSSYTRRGFLAASTAPLILPRCVLGWPGQRGANEKIVLGFVAQGGMASRLMRPMTTELKEAVAAQSAPK